MTVEDDGSPEDATAVARADDVDPAAALRPSTLLGRYLVLQEVGAGGMGRVLRAYDPKLRREVALKVLLARGQRAEGTARIVREARAMARLSHPNLVPVYDVETDDDEVFIAMEFVEGETLQAWLRRGQRSWREIVEAFVGAARGLAAAHEAGLVHRDFKPANAIVAADGRVRVMDFGIARGVAAASTTPSDATFQPTLTDLTQVGTVMGTPPYMAPEQHKGATAVPATDQYALCVALYEALYGVRPFSGADMTELARAKLRGVPAPPKRTDHAVPRWLHAAVMRGLAPAASQRWPTILELVAALERGAAKVRRQRVLMAVAAVVVVIAVIAGMRALDRRRRVEHCSEVGASISEVWNDRERARVREGLVATGRSFALVTADKLMPWLDAYASGWATARTDACLDADVRGQWDDELLDRASWCLDERRLDFEALVGELARADASVATRAVSAATALSPVASCRDPALLGRVPAPPTERRAEVRALRAELARVRALEHAGRFTEGLDRARNLVDDATAVQWTPVLAATQVSLASLLERTGAFEESARVDVDAYHEAARAGAWDVAERAASQATFVIGTGLRRRDEALGWSRHARLALAYAGDTEGIRATMLDGNLASVEFAAGNYARAIELDEGNLATLERVFDPEHPELVSTLTNLATSIATTGDHVRARGLFERALAIRERSFGSDHPDVAITLNNLAMVYTAIDLPDDARRSLERALAIREDAFGAENTLVAQSLNNLAMAHSANGDAAEADALCRRALAIRERVLGKDHPDVAHSLNNLAVLRMRAGDLLEAAELNRRAVVLREASLGADHPDTAASLHNLGNSLHALGDDRAARPLLLRALAIWEPRLGAEHPHVLVAENNLADACLALGEVEEAKRRYERVLAVRERLSGRDDESLQSAVLGLARVALVTGDARAARTFAERAVELAGKNGATEVERAHVDFVLGRALADEQPARAMGLVRQARDVLAGTGAREARSVAEIDAWIAAKRG